MSVINKMLKDLEHRRAQGFDKNTDMLDDLDAANTPPEHQNSKVWLVFALFLFVAIAATWLYLQLSGSSENKQLAESAQSEKPAIKPQQAFRSVIQEIPVEKAKAGIVANKVAPSQGDADNVAEIEPPKKSEKASASVLPLKIISLSPTPVYATGQREVLTVNGEGFRQPLKVVMEWDDGHGFKELSPWQVNVVSDGKMQLKVNFGRTEDDWRLLISSEDGTQASFRFTVLASKEKQEKSLQARNKPVTTFNKTSRILSKKQQLAVAFSRARRLMQQGKMQEAKQALRDILSQDFEHLQTRQVLAGILYREAAYDEATEVLELGRIQHPEHVPFVLLLARIYTERGQDAVAIDLLERQQPAVKDYSDYYALLAALYQRRAQYEKAAEIYTKLLANSPARAVWWMGLGLSLQSLTQNEAALDAYSKSLQTRGLSDELRRFVKTRMAQLKNEKLN